MNIHFISGLPRSGSTLLVALLGQNPRFQTGITLATLRIIQGIDTATSCNNEVALLLTQEQKWALRRAVFTALYGDSDRVVFDKNHLWCGRMPLIAQLFPDAKVICLVRDLAWIVDSFEKLFQKNPLELPAMLGWKAFSTVYTRAARISASEGVVGASLDMLREAFYGSYSDRLLLVEYNDLVSSPREQLKRIYEFIGEPEYEHDVDNVSFSSDAFDIAVGVPGLHTVKGKVEAVSRKTVLPPDLFARFGGDMFWRK